MNSLDVAKSSNAPTRDWLGARVESAGVSFRVWAPHARRVEVVFDGGGIPAVELSKDERGYCSGHSAAARAGTCYRYRLDASESHADPYSRFQPQGPFGPSMVVDPDSYRWRDAAWPGLDASRQVVYEMHIGTFTAEGTYAAAARELSALKELGITSIEILPVNEFVGSFGWGYDGVNLFAPFHHYGTADELRGFVDAAHQAGLGVILDVVYNHFGSHGNFLPRFAADYLDHETPNPWGGAPNYSCEAMRRLCIDNAVYWIREFHMDGLRLDATQNIHDPRHPALLSSLVQESRAAAAPRGIVISAEDYLQRTGLLHAGLDQVWNDDFHHAARVALTGNHAGYFKDYRGRSQELLSALRHGYLYQGQHNGFDGKPRGSPVHDEPLHAFVAFTQNHDQIANTLYGRRIDRLTSAGKARALASALLLGPNTPMIFMGQEFDASAPFAYFADYAGEVAVELWRNRKREIQGFEEYADPAAQLSVLNPCAIETVRASTLDFAERETHASTYKLYKDLLALRREDKILDHRPLVRVDGATLTEQAFLLRWYGANGQARLLLVNLGAQIGRHAIPEPLLAAPLGGRWRLVFSSNHPAYGGLGSITPVNEEGWELDAESAVFLAAG